MKLKYDTLNVVKTLISSGFDRELAEAVVAIVRDIELENLYSISEVEIMVADSVRAVLEDFRRESEVNRRELLSDIGKQFAQFDAKMTSKIDTRFSEFNKRFTDADGRISRLEGLIKGINSRLSSDKWTMVIGFASVCATIAISAIFTLH